MIVSFHNYVGDDRVGNKKPTQTAVVGCSVYDGCTVINPVLRLAYDSTIANSNYFYIADWGRYYKVTNVEVNDAKQMFVSGTVDAVLSFWGEISGCIGTASRSEKYGVGQIIDTQLPIDPSTESVYIEAVSLNKARTYKDGVIITMK